MAEMIPIKEAAACWNITERRVATLCKDGKIVGGLLEYGQTDGRQGEQHN